MARLHMHPLHERQRFRAMSAAIRSGQLGRLPSSLIAVCGVRSTQIPLLLLGCLAAQSGGNLAELPRPFRSERGAASQIGADPTLDHRRRGGSALPSQQLPAVGHDKRSGVAKKLRVVYEIGCRFHGRTGLSCQADPILSDQ